MTAERKLRIVLAGAGAEIGCNILALQARLGRNAAFTDVITRSITSDQVVPAHLRSPIRELAARVVLAAPELRRRVETVGDSVLAVDGVATTVHFRDIESDPIDDLGRFDIAVIATSKRHIRSQAMLDKFGEIADIVVGLAENVELDALYPAFLDVDPAHFKGGTQVTVDDLRGTAVTLGSCQCVGWATQLRVLIESLGSERSIITELARAELDIVHPDNASSTFATDGIGVHREDARDNFRPGISQVAAAMRRFAPTSMRNSVSLRTLTQPPGYQISRFFVASPISTESIVAAATRLAASHPLLFDTSALPIGSRAYSRDLAATVLITTPSHLTVDPIGDMFEVIMQAYVSNTVGYCASLYHALDVIATRQPFTTLAPAPSAGRAA